jgi:hypothetical protein
VGSIAERGRQVVGCDHRTGIQPQSGVKFLGRFFFPAFLQQAITKVVVQMALR